MFLTGLGTVTPPITDGDLGPTSPLSYSDLYNAGNLTVYFNDYGENGTAGNPGNITYAGLAPELAGLYQLNVQVPTSGLASGDSVYVEFVTDAADVNQIQIPYGSTSGRSLVTPARRLARATRIKAMRSQGKKPSAQHRVRGSVPATSSGS